MIATLELDNNVARIRPASHEPVSPERLAEHVRVALEQPLGYPPLCEATVPGDQVVVTLQQGLPMVRQLLAGTSAALRDAGVEVSQASVLVTQPAPQSNDTLDQLTAESGLHSMHHDPADEDDCSYVGVTQSGQALRVNRQLGDADIVLPVGLTLADLDEQNCDKFCGLFPHYCDQATVARYQDGKYAENAKHRRDQHQEIEESGWLLGVGMTVQVVPGADGTVAAVLAGEPTAVAQAATDKYRDIWHREVPRRGDLVIASITGAADQQTWQDFARALAAAESVLEPGGAIAICSQLAEMPGPSLSRLSCNDDLAQIERELRRDKFADTCTALHLAQALERGPIYLHSQLESEVVENMGLAPIGTESELSRLAESYRHPIVLEDAHRLLPSVSE